MGFVKYAWEVPQEVQDYYDAKNLELPKTGGRVDIEHTVPVYDAENDAVLFRSLGTALVERYLPDRWAFIWKDQIVEFEGSYKKILVDSNALISEATLNLESATPDDSGILESPEACRLIRQAFYTWLSPEIGVIGLLMLTGNVGKQIDKHYLKGC